MNATTTVEPLDFAKFRWHGMLAIWGQGENFHQGVCYGNMNYDPKNYFRLGEKEDPVIKLFPRWLDNETATWYLDQLVNHFIPESEARYISITRLKTKGDWPKKWKTEVQNVEILDLDYEEDNYNPADPNFRKSRTGKYRGLVPFIKVEFDQRINVKSMFTAASMFRFVSEQAAKVKCLQTLCQLFPNVSPASLIYPACLFTVNDGHGFGMMYSGDTRRIGEITRKWNFRDAWAEMVKANPQPFWEAPKRSYSDNVDSNFCPDPAAQRSPVSYMMYYDNGKPSCVLEHNGVAFKTNGVNFKEGWEALVKELSK